MHGQDEPSGRNYLMLEGTDAQVHVIYYTPEMEKSRAKGGLGTNSFIRLRKRLVNTRLAARGGLGFEKRSAEIEVNVG